MTSGLSRILISEKIRLLFPVEAVADVNATQGLIRILRLGPSSVVIQFGDEITAAMAKKAFPGFPLTRKKIDTGLLIGFNTEGPDRLSGKRHVVFNYVPYKFFALSPSVYSAKKRNALRQKMRVGSRRKVIAVSCTSRDEVFCVLEAARKIRSPQKPLFIFGLRRTDRNLAAILKTKGFMALDRHAADQPVSLFSRYEAVVLNTAGEFFDLSRAADLAIVGHDRNIFEPAFLRVPILYFGAPLEMNRKEKKMASLFGLIWRKNRLAKKYLDRFGGAKRIYTRQFHRQIEEVLKNPAPFLHGSRKAILKFEAELIPRVYKRSSRLLAKALKS